VSNNFITVAVFQGPQLQADQTSGGTSIVQGAYTHTIIPAFNLWLNLKQNVNYSLRYVVFPFRYDETVNTQFGLLTVAQTIAAMRAAYNLANTLSYTTPFGSVWYCANGGCTDNGMAVTIVSNIGSAITLSNGVVTNAFTSSVDYCGYNSNNGNSYA